jgi:UDP-N-acetyl-D-mannosaminuronic acid dehydrogenase
MTDDDNATMAAVLPDRATSGLASVKSKSRPQTAADISRCVLVGLGYIGLPTAALLASRGFDVTGVDVKRSVVEAVQRGECPIVEPGLDEAVARHVASGKLRAQTEMAKGDVFIIAVPTPFETGYKPDLSYVKAATLAVANVLERGNLVIIESTIPVGATEQVARWLAKARPDLSFAKRQQQGHESAEHPEVYVAHCPERILPGQMLRELVENDRVIGGVCGHSGTLARDFYRRFVEGDCLVTDARTAELCKLTENAFRDVNIAFANELAEVAEASQVDVWELIALANRHPRVNILKPGPGVGGHCIAVDPWFIVSNLMDKTRLIREARWINNGRPHQVVSKVMALVEKHPVSSVACFGLTYKADVDDVRESPAVEVVELLARELPLIDRPIKLTVADPYLKGHLPARLDELGVGLVGTDDALHADIIVLLVDHRDFIAIPRERLKGKLLIDTRGIWSSGRRHVEPGL